jgi:hypothetical protein
MNASEIRYLARHIIGGSPADQEGYLTLLGEIAAQLAEQNDISRNILGQSAQLAAIREHETALIESENARRAVVDDRLQASMDRSDSRHESGAEIIGKAMAEVLMKIDEISKTLSRMASGQRVSNELKAGGDPR